MRKTTIMGLSAFPLFAHASDPTGMIPYVLGYLLLVCVVTYFVTWLATESLANNWNRFYIRVLSIPVVLSVLCLTLGLEIMSMVLIVIAVVYIILFRGFCKWLR